MNNPIPSILALLPTEEPVLVNYDLIEDIRKVLVAVEPTQVWLESTIKELLTYLHRKSVVELTDVTPDTMSIRNIYKGN